MANQTTKITGTKNVGWSLHSGPGEGQKYRLPQAPGCREPNEREDVTMRYPYSKWRMATRKSFICANSGKFLLGGEPADKVCSHTIHIGQVYWDSGERSDAGIWKTWKLCESCAKADGLTVESEA